jgi:hypothetical protein
MSYLTLPFAERLALPRWLPLALVFGLAVVLRQFVVANADVSWCLTMAEKWLDGARLYVDIVEVNPPATPLLYVLPVVLERLTGLRAEIFVDALVLLAAAASLLLSARILLAAKRIDPAQAWALATLVAAALVILPAQTFGEREQIALITFLPLLAVAAARAERLTLDWRMVVLAGIGGGITAIIKPYFVAAIVCTAAASALCAKSWRVLFALENWIAAALLIAYGVFVLTAFPQFALDMVPLLSAVYLPVKEGVVSFLLHAVTPLWAAILLLTVQLKGRALLKPPYCLLLAASIGFAVSYYVQGKGWPYHSYPMLALALIAYVLAVIEQRRAPDRIQWRVQAAAAVVLAGLAFHWFNLAEDRSALAAPIKAINPHAKILALSGDLSVGHPITRAVDGAWVGRVSALWITLGAELRRAAGPLDAATEARLKAYMAQDRRMLTEDIAHNRPDVILVQRRPGLDWLGWARSDPRLAGELAAYRPGRTVGDVLILRRTVAP